MISNYLKLFNLFLQKALITLGSVIVVFMLCWIFFFIKYTFCGETNKICPDFVVNDPVLGDILFWIGYFNSMINPFLYNFTNPDFQRAFKKLLNIKQQSSNLYTNNSIHNQNNNNGSKNNPHKNSKSFTSNAYLSNNISNDYLSVISLNQVNNSVTASLNGNKR
jgi:hypothetical protein